MTIRTKTIILLGLATIVLAGAMILTARTIILQGYRDLEQDFAIRNLKRAVNTLTAAQEKLYSSTGDYASWDDTYEFVLNPATSAYRNENFVSSSFENININAMLFFNNSGTLVAQAYLGAPGSEIDSVPAEIVQALQSVNGLVPMPAHVQGRFGIIAVASKPVMVAARPILRNGSKGPSMGTLVFCRLLDIDETQKISSIVTWPVSVIAASAADAAPDSFQLHDFLSSHVRQHVEIINRTTLRGYVWIPDIAGNDTLILSCSSNRDIYRYGLRTYFYSIGWLLLIMSVFAFIVFELIQRGVLDRFIRLRRAIDAIKLDPNPSKRLPVSGRDEVTVLTADINRMLDAIEEAQQRAERVERQYHLLFDQMMSGFALLEPVRDGYDAITDYRFLEVNPAFERHTGPSSKQWVGATVCEKLSDMGPLWVERLMEVMESGSSLHFEAFSTMFRKHFEVMAFTSTNNRCGVTINDITNRKKAEEERAQAREDLAQAQKMHAVGQLAGGIAHDFNNQLAGILGYAELLQTNLTDNQKFTTYIDRVITGISRAADLTSQLLAFAHKGKYIDRPVNMHSIIMEVAALLERSIDKRISLNLRLNATSAVTLGDPTQLQNVVLNLGLNARDAMPQGGDLTFATDMRLIDEPFRTRHSSTIAPGHYLMISITDTGTGIDPETQKHLFEPFFTTKPRSKGTGMGLAASNGTISQHNGAITVYSEVDNGTTFNIYLPLCGESADEHVALKKTATIPGNPSILIVDDESLVAEMAEEMLNTMDCKVRLCSNGKEALELYRTIWKEIDLVLLDMIMPEMNGPDTFKQLRAVNPQVKVIISSGYSMNNEAQMLLNLGAAAFIQKPYTRSILSEAVVAALGKMQP